MVTPQLMRRSVRQQHRDPCRRQDARFAPPSRSQPPSRSAATLLGRLAGFLGHGLALARIRPAPTATLLWTDAQLERSRRHPDNLLERPLERPNAAKPNPVGRLADRDVLPTKQIDGLRHPDSSQPFTERHAGFAAKEHREVLVLETGDASCVPHRDGLVEVLLNIAAHPIQPWIVGEAPASNPLSGKRGTGHHPSVLLRPAPVNCTNGEHGPTHLA